MKIIFHFGAHKTASTHLQYNLALNRAYLNQQGVAYFRFQEIKNLQENADYLAANITNKKENLKPCIAKIKALINDELKGYKSAIISYEGCLGYHNHLNYSNIYPYADKIIPIYKKILKDHTVLPVYAIRDYNDYINSTYRQELAHGIMQETINTYFANKKIHPQRWTQIIELLKNGFNNDIKVFTFEEYKTQWQEICSALIKLASNEISGDKLILEAQKKNNSVSKTKLKFNYSLNRGFKYIPDFKYKKALYYRSIKHIFPLFNNSWGEKVLKSYQNKDLPILIPSEDYEKEAQGLKSQYALFY